MSRRRRFSHFTHGTSVAPPFPTADQIASRAHDLFVAGGRRLTDLPDYWRRAEQELLDRAASRALGNTATGTVRAGK